MKTDIAIVGAGLAGLTAALPLQAAGYSLLLLEKSRGLGGRLASYRLNGVRCDRGLRYLTDEGRLLSGLVRSLRERQVLRPWITTSHRYTAEGLQQNPPQTHYVAPEGMSQIAKELGRDVPVWFSRRVAAITPQSHDWRLDLEAVVAGSDAPLEVTARAVILAIPAPQALMVLATVPGMDADVINPLQSVTYDPCLTLLAQYSGDRVPDRIPWKSVEFPDDPDLSWLGLDSSKRESSSLGSDRPVVVINSRAELARSHLDDRDLTPVIEHLLSQGAARLGDWLQTPEHLHLHRWRYAIPAQVWPQDSVVLKTPFPLVCCGDWCGSRQVETALRSGLAAASSVNYQLDHRSLAPIHSLWGG
ncbi:MAG: FAD-dependent oxidoreductase [Sodalinema sp.]|uniref:NAD(P)/FAD-dependent oxidoreductase n=1 Tax=Sodalinema sp. TaxID=3080550 RepID=UPI0011FFD88B|nr:MAG: FAD-dependent oxidoreductase [Phormidium sp. SL48-SHIP]